MKTLKEKIEDQEGIPIDKQELKKGKRTLDGKSNSHIILIFRL